MWRIDDQIQFSQFGTCFWITSLGTRSDVTSKRFYANLCSDPFVGLMFRLVREYLTAIFVSEKKYLTAIKGWSDGIIGLRGSTNLKGRSVHVGEVLIRSGSPEKRGRREMAPASLSRIAAAPAAPRRNRNRTDASGVGLPGGGGIALARSGTRASWARCGLS